MKTLINHHQLTTIMRMKFDIMHYDIFENRTIKSYILRIKSYH